jgi:hypothetical protein
LWAEFDQLSGMLQEKAIETEGKVIGWNAQMRPDLVATTLRDIAWYAYRHGRVQLAPLFADRAAVIAGAERASRRDLWLRIELDGADIHNRAGDSVEALPRIESLLREIERGSVGDKELPFEAKRVRAQTLSNLGRYEGALKAIDEMAPVEEATLGVRHPNVLATRYFSRADAVQSWPLRRRA